MGGAEEFLGKALELAGRAAETQLGAVRVAAGLVADAVAGGKTFWVFGTGHSHLIAEELYGRAGGLASVRAVLEPGLMLHEGLLKSSLLERLGGLADVLLQVNEVREGDVVLIVSNSGRNAVPVEFAQGVRAAGGRVVALTSLAHSTAVESRAASGLRLFEIADVVIDNCGVPGDALVEVVGSPERTGSTSTLVGALLAQALVVEVVTRLAERGHTPDVLRSQNA
jgi:uncharacterized phosphosugar-binding protein